VINPEIHEKVIKFQTENKIIELIFYIKDITAKPTPPNDSGLESRKEKKEKDSEKISEWTFEIKKDMLKETITKIIMRIHQTLIVEE